MYGKINKTSITEGKLVCENKLIVWKISHGTLKFALNVKHETETSIKVTQLEQASLN